MIYTTWTTSDILTFWNNFIWTNSHPNWKSSDKKKVITTKFLKAARPSGWKGCSSADWSCMRMSRIFNELKYDVFKGGQRNALNYYWGREEPRAIWTALWMTMTSGDTAAWYVATKEFFVFFLNTWSWLLKVLQIFPLSPFDPFHPVPPPPVFL